MPAAVVVTVRAATAADAQPIQDAFQRVFAAVDPAFRARATAHWDWLYQRSPRGAPAVIAVDEGGRVLAHYAALSLAAVVAGQPALFAQAIDSFSVRDEARGLARRGLFTACGEAWAAQHFGTSAGRHAFVYGLPVESAWRVGARTLGYELLHENLVLGVRAAALARTPDGFELEEPPRFPADIGEFTARARAPSSAELVRDAVYLDWRYVDVPLRSYRRAVLRSQGVLRGLGVLRVGEFGARRAALVCEQLTEPGDAAARVALQAWLARTAQELGSDELLAFVAPHTPEFLADQRVGWRVRRVGNPWAARSAWPRLAVRDLARLHVASLGDTDLA